MVYPLLSDEWVSEARRIRAEFDDDPPAVPLKLRLNVVITDLPSGQRRADVHLDTTGAAIDIEFDHLEHPDVTVTLEWQTARDLLVEGTPQIAVAAFIGGRIKIDGDFTKLLGISAAGQVDSRLVDVLTRLRDLTE